MTCPPWTVEFEIVIKKAILGQLERMDALRAFLAHQSYVAGIPKSLATTFIGEIVREDHVNKR